MQAHLAQLTAAAPSTETAAWPPMHHYDIWSADLKALTSDTEVAQRAETASVSELNEPFETNDDDLLLNNLNDLQENEYSAKLAQSIGWQNQTTIPTMSSRSTRRGKVIHLFPVPVDGECLSDDGRRLGNCFNAYECRQKGGTAKGECAMGFGVCCVFVANCNETITNNITYIVSPNFPSFMPSNFTGCSLKVKMMSEDISQLRIDFYHFSLGQPNRRTGVCDGDVFNISGGPSGSFSLCGQNSGQHLYYDVGSRALPRQSQLYGSLRPLSYAQLYGNLTNGNSSAADQLIDINLNFSNRFLPIRLWEIRVAQIPFSQRAPAGCLQYHTGVEGIMQTFNFADNGRHLANQHYRICVRQETDMCSIMYQPCDEQSFRIGGGGAVRMGAAASPTAGAIMNGGGQGGAAAGGPNGMPAMNGVVNSDMATTPASVQADDAASTTGTTMSTSTIQLTSDSSSSASTAMPTMASSDASSSSSSATTMNVTTAAPQRSSTVAAMEEESSTAASTTDTPSSSPVNDDVEGSGDDGNDGGFNLFGGASPTTAAPPGVSRRPRPVGGAGGGSGGFDLLGFLRSAFDLRLRHRRRRQSRQFFSTCRDRITMPCIIEDFIGTGLGPLPGCEPVHCGAQFCSSGVWPCRIESTVTPFYIGVHFGNDAEGKGSPEDNIGACLRYAQVQCM
ncbi:uncharacterized protein LOC115631218 [Scaptodrosophila lebanonensis]|uniref:Uncharacterized protein LOC115631218 n=1 Tax=Drosophila lebanonensis TaxID=7225 RepID=A0A6J2U627_DROLE|nr:uncharacterized protein LOC115631218 [Scaptodrosophila lebanonensis]